MKGIIEKSMYLTEESMNSGLFEVYINNYFQNGLGINIGHNSVSDWCVSITAHKDRSKDIVFAQSCDLNLALAKAEVELKEWLIENKGGY